MLSRVAESLYWMSRYIERAENTARLVEVNLQLLLDFEGQADDDEATFWAAVVSTSGAVEAFRDQHPVADANTVVDFLAFEPANPSAIFASVAAARENARMVRDQITTEMWECLNELYHFVRAQNVTTLWEGDILAFFERVRQHSATFQGLTDACFLHEEAHHFLEVGKYLERADQTSRLLDLKYFLLLPEGQTVGGAVDLAGWIAVLRSCSAADAFHQRFPGALNASKVFQLLLFGRKFPRSVRFALRRLDENLRAISDSLPGHHQNEAERLVGALRSHVVYSTMEDVFALGPHQYIDNVQSRLGDVHDAIHAHYLAPPVTDLASEIARHQHEG